MQKTCTYQSVTTVNSHGTTNSSVVPVSHVGLTTNYSKTKKTVVTDEECKNKVNYSSGSVVNNSYCVTSESPCSIGHHADCCKFHAHSSPQIIPFAHVQTCGLGHSLSRTSESSSSSPSHCDGNFAVHRFGHQPTVIYSPPSPEYGCCCSSPLVQNVHEPCLIRKSLLTYPHHPGNFAPQATDTPLCADYHHPPDTRHFSSPPSRCCSCCDHQPATGLQYLTSSPKTGSSSVVCEQSPLDLSLASASSSSSVESDMVLSQGGGHCPSQLCCSTRKVLLLRTSGGFQNFQTSPSSSCYRFLSCESQGGSSDSMGLQQQCKSSLDPVVPTVVVTASTSSSQTVATSTALVSASGGKREKQLRLMTTTTSKKRQFAHGWSWKGKPREKLVALTNDSAPCPRICYPSVEHKEGDVINEKDCVLLRSGPKDTDLPYVAKVATLWENPDDGEMMMSLLWYYRPEHTDHGREPGQMEDEVFASRHKDVNSIACIEDKCYVLTYNEYCRYRAKQTMEENKTSMSSRLVPGSPDGYPRRSRQPSEVMATDIIFFCRHVYDFRQKRILKNPT